MTSRQPALLVSDASVLIDYCNAGCKDMLAIVSHHFLPIRVPREVLAEAEDLTIAEAHALGIEILEVEPAEVKEATVRGGPSQQDRLCFVVARNHGGAARQESTPQSATQT